MLKSHGICVGLQVNRHMVKRRHCWMYETEALCCEQITSSTTGNLVKCLRVKSLLFQRDEAFLQITYTLVVLTLHLYFKGNHF